MSELTPKEPKTPEEKRARAHKIRTMVLDMFLPVLAALGALLYGLGVWVFSRRDLPL